MPTLQEIGQALGTEPVAGIAAYDEAPAQRGGFMPLPQPGRYVFQLPVEMGHIWNALEDIRVPGQEGKTATYLQLRFDDAAPLTILSGGADPQLIGTNFMPAISNIPRNRARKQQTPVYFSDLDYLLREAFGVTGGPFSNQQYAQMVQQHAGQAFTATVSWNWYQAPHKNIWIMVGPGGNVATQEEINAQTAQLQEIEGVTPPEKISYYQSQVSKEADGKYPMQLQVPTAIGGQTYNVCVRANAQLERFGVAPSPTA
jgi:hypothetical protein